MIQKLFKKKSFCLNIKTLNSYCEVFQKGYKSLEVLKFEFLYIAMNSKLYGTTLSYGLFRKSNLFNETCL